MKTKDGHKGKKLLRTSISSSKIYLKESREKEKMSSRMNEELSNFKDLDVQAVTDPVTKKAIEDSKKIDNPIDAEECSADQKETIKKSFQHFKNLKLKDYEDPKLTAVIDALNVPISDEAIPDADLEKGTDKELKKLKLGEQLTLNENDFEIVE